VFDVLFVDVEGSEEGDGEKGWRAEEDNGQADGEGGKCDGCG